MSPNFLPDDYVVVARFPCLRYRANQVVLVNHPSFGVMIKRIDTVTTSGIYLSGDNLSDTLSTEKMGLILFADVIGRVYYRITPAKRSKSSKPSGNPAKRHHRLWHCFFD